MSPKYFMITGFTKQALLTEYAYLSLKDKHLTASLLCYCVPAIANEFKRGNMNIIDISRNDIRIAQNILLELRNKMNGPIITNILHGIEKKYKLSGHVAYTLGFYLDYIEDIRNFLDKGYYRSFGEKLELIAR